MRGNDSYFGYKLGLGKLFDSKEEEIVCENERETIISAKILINHLVFVKKNFFNSHPKPS